MAELIKTTDSLNDGRKKLNDAITDSNAALSTANTAKQTANLAKAESESTQTQLDTIVIEGDSSVEAAQARVNNSGTAFPTLKQRLDAEHQEVTAQLQQTVKKGDLIVDVRDFGAKGDYNHVTRIGFDNTVAFNAAIASLPSNGGTLIIPAGEYLIPNGGIIIDKPITIIGDGAGTYDSGGTRIFTHSSTANLFTLTKGGTVVSGIAFINSSQTRPTAGSAILCTDFDWGRIERCLFRGFWNNVQVDSGYFYSFRDSAFLAPVNYGCYMRNTAPGQHDHGDQVLEGCNFSKYGDPIDGGTAVRWESGGGLRIIGCKVNAGTQPGYTNTGFFDNGFVTVMQPGGTSVHTITGCSVEGWKTYGISISGTANAAFGKIAIAGNEFLASGEGGSCIHADGKDMISLDSLAITGNVGYGPSGGVILYNLTEVVYTGNNWAGCTQTALTISGVTSLIQGDNLWKSTIFDLDGSSEVYSNKIGHYRGDWVWGYDLVDQSGTALLGKVSPGKHSTLILTIRVYGNIATKGGVILEQRRAISRVLGNASVTQTVGTDLDIGAGSGELLIEYDTTTSANFVIPKVTSVNGNLFNGAVEITVNGIISSLYYV